MCGFAGVIANPQYLAVQDSFLQQMGFSIQHRGPDDQGIFITPDQKLGMVHRRLAIQDLSAAGHQPMHSKDQRYTLAFNGEIYNHLTLRKTLEQDFGCQWLGHSDTETLLAGIQHWGLEKTVKAAVGMFAMALWDHSERTLTLVRDRAGEKPLYYGFAGGVFLFGSELKALKVHPAFNKQLDLQALALMLQHKYVPAPRTIYQHYAKLPPGTMLKLQIDKPEQQQLSEYWSFSSAALQARQQSFTGGVEEGLAELERTLKQAVSEQMLADVPLGAFLSGGTDSSLIAALMQAQSSKPVKTFTVGFNVPAYNEAEHAKAVAKYLGTEHTEIYVDEQDALAMVPKLASLYDEPFADSSQIPTYLITAEAKKHVTVALSGDAGDELFAGYTRYFRCADFAARLQKVPALGFSLLKLCQPLLHPDIWRALDSLLGNANKGTLVHSAERLADLAQMQDRTSLYRYMVSDWKHPQRLLSTPVQMQSLFSALPYDKAQNFFDWMMLADSQSYLPDDVLVKVDRAAMANSLETRVPMLDHRVIELALRLPLSMKVNEQTGKWALKEILYRYVPKTLLDRPKTGFGVPIDHWLRGPLKEWAESLLSEDSLRQQGLFNVKLVRQYWREHQTGGRDWQYPLWNLLMFQHWLSQQA